MVENSAEKGGGIYGGARLYDCIVYFNNAAAEKNYAAESELDSVVANVTCTTPLPPNGVGNITGAPFFVDPSSGDFRLQSNSPCVNAGRNSDAPGGGDLDGNPRIVGGTVDLGAYEFQSFRLLPPLLGPWGAVLNCESAAGRHYSVERSTNSPGAPVFTPLAVDLIGEPGTTTYTDVAPHFPHALYRVRLIE